MDGTRTRDPRRDRPVPQSSIGAGLLAIRYSKVENIDAALARAAAGIFQRIAEGFVKRPPRGFWIGFGFFVALVIAVCWAALNQ
ncbi:MAG: hypothetical protein RL244_183 [Pseudomonadota bacterium]